ncbi:MAG: alpha/beta fold hydrolase, partial [Myxococcota bacterium]
MRYVDEGPRSNDVVLLFHGLPTYSYLWRDVIAPIAERERVIAFDQLGQGFTSRHPSLSYTFKQHLAHAEAFIESLDLAPDAKITVVVHDSGGAVGLAFASRHPDRIKGLVFFETVLGPIPSEDVLPARAQYFRSRAGQRDIIRNNAFVRDLLFDGHLLVPPSDSPFLVEPLNRAEKLAYALPYLRRQDRRVTALWPSEIPTVGDRSTQASANLDLFEAYAAYLVSSDTPKLLLFADPGVLIPPAVVPSLEATIGANGSLTTVDLGRGFHYLQEDHGSRIGQEIRRWLRNIDGDPETPSPAFQYQTKKVDVWA